MDNSYTDDNIVWNTKTIILYVINHFEKFLLLCLAIIIVYFVDYISNINAMIYASPQIIPGLNNHTNTKPIIKPNIKQRNKHKK